MTDRTVVHVAYPGIALLDLVRPADVFAVGQPNRRVGPALSLVVFAEPFDDVSPKWMRQGLDASLASPLII